MKESVREMQFQLVFETAVGDSLLLLSGTISPQLLPLMSMRVADLSEFIPGLKVVALDHTITMLTFSRGHCRLHGEKIHWHELSQEVGDG